MLLALVACRTATVLDACDADPAYCVACASDDECSFGGNACTETVYCSHQDAGVSVIQIGCSPELEYSWPPDDECTCVEGECRSEP